MPTSAEPPHRRLSSQDHDVRRNAGKEYMRAEHMSEACATILVASNSGGTHENPNTGIDRHSDGRHTRQRGLGRSAN
jgi:hypothetical protein